jgi:hypothetical protein
VNLIWAVADEDRGRVTEELAAIYTRLLLRPICDRQNSRTQESWEQRRMRLSLVIGLRGGYQVDDHGISTPQLISLALALAALPAHSVPASAFRHHVFL